MNRKIVAGMRMRLSGWMYESGSGSCPSLAADNITLHSIKVALFMQRKHERTIAGGIIIAAFFPNIFSTKVVATVSELAISPQVSADNKARFTKT